MGDEFQERMDLWELEGDEPRDETPTRKRALLSLRRPATYLPLKCSHREKECINRRRIISTVSPEYDSRWRRGEWVKNRRKPPTSFGFGRERPISVSHLSPAISSLRGASLPITSLRPGEQTGSGTNASGKAASRGAGGTMNGTT